MGFGSVRSLVLRVSQKQPILGHSKITTVQVIRVKLERPLQGRLLYLR